MKLVQVLKAAAMSYGPERRVLLLHGPVGSSKSTIARLLKRGMEHYSRTPDGALYTFSWVDAEVDIPERGGAARPRDALPDARGAAQAAPAEFRAAFLERINERLPRRAPHRCAGRPLPRLPPRLQRACSSSTTATGRG